MSQIQALSQSQFHRRKAETCARLAGCAQSSNDREQLLQMGEASLARALHEELIDGLPPLPPASSGVLRRPRRG